MLLEMKSKHRHLLSKILALVVLVGLADILFLLYGGEYLAKQIIPPLPSNSVVSDCFSQHTALCKNINYTANGGPQEILSRWSTSIDQNENLNGKTVYHSKKCNESWLGLHYASFHKRREPACAMMAAWSENNSNTTNVFIQLTWSVCPNVIYKYFPRALYFRCFEG